MLDPLLGPREHGLRSSTDIEQRVAGEPAQRQTYAEAYGTNVPVVAKNVAESLATYVSTLRTSDSLFDRYAFRNDPAALNSEEVFGYELFMGRAGCAACHLVGKDAAPFTDNRFHNQGIGASYLTPKLRVLVDRALSIEPQALSAAIQSDQEISALGRFLVTHKPTDIGAFRTPSLRNVFVTSPYMHDGSISTLREAVKHELYYAAPDRGANFSYAEQEALVAFLRTLTDEHGSAETLSKPRS